jgi:hypothetical protein
VQHTIFYIYLQIQNKPIESGITLGHQDPEVLHKIPDQTTPAISNLSLSTLDQTPQTSSGSDITYDHPDQTQPVLTAKYMKVDIKEGHLNRN